MRARYDAYVRRDAEFLNVTWHPRTHQSVLSFDDLADIRWRGLAVVDTVRGGEADADGVVEFRAGFIGGDGVRDEIHERSFFVKEDGRWYYVGDDLDDEHPFTPTSGESA
jgi:SEC-C motif-containing protein